MSCFDKFRWIFQAIDRVNKSRVRMQKEALRNSEMHCVAGLWLRVPIPVRDHIGILPCKILALEKHRVEKEVAKVEKKVEKSKTRG